MIEIKVDTKEELYDMIRLIELHRQINNQKDLKIFTLENGIDKHIYDITQIDNKYFDNEEDAIKQVKRHGVDILIRETKSHIQKSDNREER